MGRRLNNPNQNAVAVLVGMVVIAAVAILVVLLTAGFYIFPLVLVAIAAFTRAFPKSRLLFPIQKNTIRR